MYRQKAGYLSIGSLIVRLKLIACKVLYREISAISASCGNYIDVTYIRQGYHNEPQKLSGILQREINRVDSGEDAHTSDTASFDFDAILLGYGLCSNGATGIYSNKYPIVIPRAHDCITLMLGSAKRYRQIFDECSGGVYWYSSGWIESCPMPCEKNDELKKRQLIKKYGLDNGTYLEDIEREKLRQYKRAAFIDNGFKTLENAEFAKSAADYYGWEYKKYESDSLLLRDFLNGNWDDERFLVLPPCSSAAPSYDEKIIRAVKTR